MTRQMFRVCIGTLSVLAATGGSARAQTIVINPRPILPPIRHPIPPIPRPIPFPIPRPLPLQRDTPLDVKKHAVEVNIVDGVALTRIDQVFVNPYDRIVEGTYIFPLDDDVAINRFSMFVNGEEIEGKLLGVEEARRTYESIVAKMRDPALLEYLGTRMIRARIFPINPKSEVRVKLSYTQLLRADDGLVRYRYPFGTDRSLRKPIESVSAVVHLKSSVPIKSIFSPTHKLAIARPSDYEASASYEANNIVPDRNLELYYTLSDKEFGMTILTYAEKGEDGFFLARIAPPISSAAKDVLPKDISFVLDTSGSMSGEKIVQARKALKFCLANLNGEDRFNVISFSHEPILFRETLVRANAKNVKEARAFADGLSANGGTNINDALLAALDSASHLETDRPYLIVFLTDGLPTVGVTQTDEILKSVRGRNDGRTRLYVFGVGYDVNTQLLDLLAEQNRGARNYVEPGEDLELALSNFYRKVAEPVLANLSLSFGDLAVYDLFPAKLTDLFAGTELVVAGRYKGEGSKAVELSGTRRGRLERFVDETTFPAESKSHDFLPRVWATRKIGYMLDEIRLHGDNKELRETIVQLATRYGIVTPYTAYLVTEPGGVAQRGGRDGELLREALQASPAFEEESYAMQDAASVFAPSVAGNGRPSQQGRLRRAARVRASRAMRGYRSAARPADLRGSFAGRPIAENGKSEGRVAIEPIVRYVAGRTFYRIGDRWIDAAYDKQTGTTKVKLFSKAYFDLIRNHPELAKCFALGERVVVVIEGVTYETVPPVED